MNWSAIYQYNFSDNTYTLAARTDEPTRTQHALVLQLVEQEPMALTPENTNVDRGLVQALMDAFWKAGVRPNGYTTEEQIGAINRHLADMQRVAFTLLDDKVKA